MCVLKVGGGGGGEKKESGHSLNGKMAGSFYLV